MFSAGDLEPKLMLIRLAGKLCLFMCLTGRRSHGRPAWQSAAVLLVILLVCLTHGQASTVLQKPL